MNIGTILPFLATKVPDGWLSCENGAEISRTTYPELWAWVQENAPLVSETEWQTLAVKQTSVGYYSSGDGSTTFRLPRIVDFIQGSAPTDSGKFTEAGLPNITGNYRLQACGPAADISGAFSDSATYSAELDYMGTAGGHATPKIVFDASKSNAVYGKSTTVQPASVKMVYCVRAFGVLTNQGTIDVTSLANDVTHRGIEVGTILPFLAKKAPVGWLALDTGAELSRSTYSALWDWVQVNAPVISEEDWQKQAKVQTSVGSYSTGDGSTTFRLPKIVDFVQGTSAADAGTYMSAGLPNITGSTIYSDRGYAVLNTDGAFTAATNTSATKFGSTDRDNGSKGYNFDASKSNAIYGNSTTVQPVAVKMLYCVKAFGTAINKNDIDISTLVNDKVSLAALPGLTTGRIVAQSLDTNGWVKFDNGLILQWGTVAVSASASVAVVFPISFSVIPKIIHSNNGYATITYQTTEKSISGFSVICGSSNIVVDWIAISK